MAIRTILRLQAVKAATGFESTSQIYELMARGDFRHKPSAGTRTK